MDGSLFLVDRGFTKTQVGDTGLTVSDYAAADGKAVFDLRRALRPLDLADSAQAQRLLGTYAIEALNDQNDVTRVYWLCGKIGVNSTTIEKVKQSLETVEPQRSYTILFVKFGENCTVTPPARKDLASIPAFVEFFESRELLYNIKENELQSKFTVLLPREVLEIKVMYGASDDQLPKLTWEDPMRRYYGLKVGQIVRCKRLAENGVDPIYRIVEKAAE